MDSILAHNVVHWAVRHGHVPVLELLRERLGSHAFSSDHAMTALKHRPCRMNGVRYIAALDGDITADPFGYMHTSWDAVFSEAARRGADVELLRLLYERRGAAVDLEAVEAGGSVEAAEWAAGALRQAAVAGQVRAVGGFSWGGGGRTDGIGWWRALSISLPPTAQLHTHTQPHTRAMRCRLAPPLPLAAQAEQAAARTSGQVEAAASGIQEALAPA